MNYFSQTTINVTLHNMAAGAPRQNGSDVTWCPVKEETDYYYKDFYETAQVNFLHFCLYYFLYYCMYYVHMACLFIVFSPEFENTFLIELLVSAACNKSKELRLEDYDPVRC